MNGPKILSIIITYNALQRNWLYKCIESLESSVLKTDVFVVDNFSTDNTVSEIEKKFPDVILLKSEENLGFAKGNNLGFKKAIEENYDFIFLLNQDAWINENTLAKLVEAQSAHPEYGILSPIHYNGEGNNLEELFAKFILNNSSEGRKFYFDSIENNTMQKVYSTNYIHAACWLISNKCFRKVGHFDDVLFKQYGEDDNYVNRALYHGFLIGIVPKTIVYHDTEFRKSQKTAHQFDNNLLTFNDVGSNMMDADAIAKMDEIILKDKNLAMYYLRRLKFTLYQSAIKNYHLKVKQKHIVLEQREAYTNFKAEDN